MFRLTRSWWFVDVQKRLLSDLLLILLIGMVAMLFLDISKVSKVGRGRLSH
jgi:hypothetical protein